MYAIATAMLLMALAGSIIAWPYRAGFTGGLLFAAFEASLVGALADWFAVVALFRHPLGLKFIPHTAIIPNNRGRIIEGIVKIVEKDWLSLDFIQAKLQEYPIIDDLAKVLETDEGHRGLERVAQSIVTNTLQHLDSETAARFVHTMLADNIAQIKIAPSLVEQLETSVKNLYGEDLIGVCLDWGIAATKGEEFERTIKKTLTRAAADYSNRGGFIRRLGKGLGESLDIVNYDEATETLARRINHLLVDMKDPTNHYHIKIKSELDQLQIADPESASGMLGELLKKIVNTEAGFKATVDLINALKTQLMDGGEEEMPTIKYLSDMVIEQINSIREDEVRKATIEDWIKDELTSLLERYHGVIGSIVREKLQGLNDAGLVQSLEDKVGDDLQWIRINGTVIGAMVGIAQYLLLHLM
jgi:uncharacterized membrane-anchored protein YjiN (DUF445 family)